MLRSRGAAKRQPPNIAVVGAEDAFRRLRLKQRARGGGRCRATACRQPVVGQQPAPGRPAVEQPAPEQPELRRSALGQPAALRGCILVTATGGHERATWRRREHACAWCRRLHRSWGGCCGVSDRRLGDEVEARGGRARRAKAQERRPRTEHGRAWQGLHGGDLQVGDESQRVAGGKRGVERRREQGQRRGPQEAQRALGARSA
mmetsp:Transcript_13127/g.37767  ORF Transcript_13127/g.37767 Transcript_13127/m.37767 type:complete len:204 (-) Transcript_13127:737-1348(-)